MWVQGVSQRRDPVNPESGSNRTRGRQFDPSITDLQNFFLDPTLARKTTNISIDDYELLWSQQAFSHQWNLQADNPLMPSDQLSWSQLFADLLDSLSPSLQLRYSYPSDCADSENCFAVQLTTGDCVCRTTT